MEIGQALRLPTSSAVHYSPATFEQLEQSVGIFFRRTCDLASIPGASRTLSISGRDGDELHQFQ